MKYYLLAFLLLLGAFTSALLPASFSNQKTDKPGTEKVIFKSTDGGQTWQDISKGLPETLPADSLKGSNFFTNDKGLFLKTPNGVYHNTANATTASWTREISPTEPASKPATFYWGVNLIKENGTSIWSPVFDDVQAPRIRTSFQTASGDIFLGTDKGLFKTTNNGKSWKHVYAGGLMGHLAEANGVLIASSMRKIIRSTDGGENWSTAISEDAVVFDVKPINGGFVAISSTAESNKRRLSTSYDGGKSWQSIHSRLQDKNVIDSIWRTWDDRPRVKTFMASIIQVGNKYFCTHTKGIFRSSDKGNTWTLLLPSVSDKGFNIFVSGNVIYLIPSKGGC